MPVALGLVGLAIAVAVVALALRRTAAQANPSHAAPTNAAPAAADSAHGVFAFEVRTMTDSGQSLGDFRGKALLIVNTASRCGFTPQYRSLEALYERFQRRGFEVLAFPANNFLGQEPGTNAEIRQFCTAEYHTTFPLFAKISVKGGDIAPLYHYLTHESGFPGDIPWNFTKFLVAPDGRVVARFGPNTDPLDSTLTSKLETILPARER
jgi:glutathione peroxidase